MLRSPRPVRFRQAAWASFVLAFAGVAATVAQEPTGPVGPEDARVRITIRLARDAMPMGLGPVGGRSPGPDGLSVRFAPLTEDGGSGKGLLPEAPPSGPEMVPGGALGLTPGRLGLGGPDRRGLGTPFPGLSADPWASASPPLPPAVTDTLTSASPQTGYHIAWPPDDRRFFLDEQADGTFRRTELAEREGYRVVVEPALAAGALVLRTYLSRSAYLGARYDDGLGAFLQRPTLSSASCSTSAPVTPGLRTVLTWRNAVDETAGAAAPVHLEVSLEIEGGEGAEPPTTGAIGHPPVAIVAWYEAPCDSPEWSEIATAAEPASAILALRRAGRIAPTWEFPAPEVPDRAGAAVPPLPRQALPAAAGGASGAEDALTVGLGGRRNEDGSISIRLELAYRQLMLLGLTDAGAGGVRQSVATTLAPIVSRIGPGRPVCLVGLQYTRYDTVRASGTPVGAFVVVEPAAVP